MGSSAQSAQDSAYYTRLYYLCKIWGHVKYFHTEIAAGKINWDDALVAAVDEVKNAGSDSAFNGVLIKLINNAGEMKISSGTLPEIIDSIHNNRDQNWIHDPLLSNSVSALLDTIRFRHRSQSNVYLDEEWTNSNPFNKDTLYHLGAAYPVEGKRMLALFRYWNVIHYFFPYKDIMDQHWDTTLIEFIPRIVNAWDALSYNLAFRELTACIDDSHAYFQSPAYDEWRGKMYAPFRVRNIENEMVITRVVDWVGSIAAGDVVREIDGHGISELRDSLQRYAHGSNMPSLDRALNDLILRGKEGEFMVTVDNGSETHTEILMRESKNVSGLEDPANAPAWKTVTRDNRCRIGIVDMGILKVNQVEYLFRDLGDADAIIFDMRSYPNLTLWEIVNYLFPDQINIANFTIPDVLFPGRMTWWYEYIGSGTSNPYTGQVIILFDERTLSQAEYTCMGLEQFPGAIKIGSTTAAADGNVAAVFLPGRMVALATFMGTYYPDFTPTQRVGIIPDYEVTPTISGIRDGIDEGLEFALNMAECKSTNIKGHGQQSWPRIYPNPVNGLLTIETNSPGHPSVEITSLHGQLLYTGRMEGPVHQIDLSSFEKGLYFITVRSANTVRTEKIIKQ